MEEVGIVLAATAVILACVIWHYMEKKRGRKARKRRRNEEFGADPLKLSGIIRCRNRIEEIGIYYEETKEELPKEKVDAVTWNDLDMDEVFLRINHTRSYMGEQVLYWKLHAVGEQVPAEWEEQVAYLMEHPHVREELEELLESIGKTREDYYLPMFLKNAECLKVERLWFYRGMQLLLLFSAVLSAVTRLPAFVMLLIGTALLNVSIYAISKERYEVYLYALGSVRQLVSVAKELVEEPVWRERYVTKELEEAVHTLKKLARAIGKYQGKKKSAWTGDAFDIFRDYLIGGTLWDITAFGRIAKLIDGKQRELFVLYEAIGRIDMEISVASFRKSLPSYCVPQFRKEKERDEEKIRFEAKELYHPLLSEPVCNDFFPKKNCMITGANASGKSTFSKAVAINAILGQTIHTAAASALVMEHMQVITSMAVRDDIMSGESYYIKEVSYLKRIVDAVTETQVVPCDKSMPVLCIIDEILRGTNTGERIAASEAVCRYLAKRKCLAIVATHDMELAESMSGQYDCYYFTNDIREKEIYFDYKIHEGYGKNRNAIVLLSYMKFPAEIVDMAQGLA